MNSATEDNARGSGRTPAILLLDDDSNTLLALSSILDRIAVRVMECEDETCAVQHCQAPGQNIDLLVADVVLQGTNGPAVVRRLKPLQPLMRLLYISGFGLTELHRRGLLSAAEMVPGSVEFLQKPFAPHEFLARVSSLLAN